jgi:ABC-type anion transport system duplicated permease subunit
MTDVLARVVDAVATGASAASGFSWPAMLMNEIVHSGATIADVEKSVTQVEADKGNIPQEAVDAAKGLGSLINDFITGL